MILDLSEGRPQSLARDTKARIRHWGVYNLILVSFQKVISVVCHDVTIRKTQPYKADVTVDGSMWKTNMMMAMYTK